MTIEFHEQAAARFNTLAQELLTKVCKFPTQRPRPTVASQIHPVAHLSEMDVIGEIEWKQRSVNGLGEETGRYWETNTGRLGYEDDGYIAARDLAKRLEQATPLKGRVSLGFLLDQLFEWLRETLDSKRQGTFTDFIASKVSQAVKVQEI